MHFIERLFGISPDGGSGSLEFLLFIVPLCALLYWGAIRAAKRTRTR